MDQGSGRREPTAISEHCHGRHAARLGFGLAYWLAAVALLLQTVDVVEVQGVVILAILLVCGLWVLGSGVQGGQGSAPGPDADLTR
jgi:hypothetical protein